MTTASTHPAPTTSQETLRAHLSGRAVEEQRLVEFYARLVDTAPGPLRALAEAMLHDGCANHEMVATLLRTWIENGAAGEPTDAQAWQRQHPSPSGEAFFAARHFLESERDELARLRDWAGELESHRDSMFFALLLRLLELDAAKHMAVLDFVRHTTDPVSVL